MEEREILKGVEEKIRFSRDEVRLIEKHRDFIQQDKDMWEYSRYKIGDSRGLSCSAMAKFLLLQHVNAIDRIRMQEIINKEEGKKEDGQ